MLRPVALLSTVILAAAPAAQLQKGGTPPPFAFDKVWNGGPTEFGDLAGKVVILDFAQTW